MASNHRPDILNEDLLALRKQGLSNKEIAAKVGVTQRTVYDRIGKACAVVDGRRKRKRPNDPVKMQKLRDRGLSNKEIAEKLDVSTRTVERGIGSDAQHRQQAESTDMRKLYESGMTKTAIAKQFGVSLSTVNRRLQAPAETTPVEPQKASSEPLEAEVAVEVKEESKTPQKPIKRREIDTKLFSFAYVPQYPELIEQLAKMAIPESWRFSEPSPLTRYPDTEILNSYLHNIFRLRAIEYNTYDAEDADKIIRVHGKVGCFHTGLYTPNYRGIYMCFTPNPRNDVRQAWYCIGFYDDISSALNGISRLPEHRWLRPGTVQVFDPSREIRINTEHIINPVGRETRLPENVLANWNTPLLLETAIELSRRITRVKPQTAVPSSRFDRVCYLLPLYFTNPDTPDVAAVLEDMGEYYHCRTVLTLKQAYLNARITGRPTAEWLVSVLDTQSGGGRTERSDNG